MPVECSVEINPVGQERFHAIDRVVMRHAFDIHNTLGRFCDERIYQEELARRCRAGDFDVHREALLHFLDGPGIGIQPVDIEVADRIVGAHRMCKLNAGSAWHLSAVRQHLSSYEKHMLRLLNHTRLEKLHWINIDQRTVTFKTLTK